MFMIPPKVKERRGNDYRLLLQVNVPVKKISPIQRRRRRGFVQVRKRDAGRGGNASRALAEIVAA
jgi:hypothetical protein